MMAILMGYVCSCGRTWSTDQWDDVLVHLEATTGHVVTEGYYKDTDNGVPATSVINLSLIHI